MVHQDDDPVPADSAAERDAPRIRSFVVRAGRIGPGQARALGTLAPRFVVPFAAAPVDFARVFGRDAPLAVEIGFGMGRPPRRSRLPRPTSTSSASRCIRPVSAHCCSASTSSGSRNVRIVQHDAVEVLESMIAPASLAAIHVFFPDPWHKKRHHKRRLIQAPFVRLLASRLAPGATLHCATDWLPYAEQMLAVLGAEPLLVNAAGDGFAPRPPSRPLTKFEQRGLDRGHGVRDLVFTRRD